MRRWMLLRTMKSKPFKPVPDGFEIDFGRMVLPAGEKE
jgi:hypothetical protein